MDGKNKMPRMVNIKNNRLLSKKMEWMGNIKIMQWMDKIKNVIDG